MKKFYFRYWKNLSSFQKWQVFLGAFTVILASIFACLQWRINQNLLELASFPNIEISYKEQRITGEKGISMINRSSAPVYFWGSRFENDSFNYREQGSQLLVPGGSLNLWLEKKTMENFFDRVEIEGTFSQNAFLMFKDSKNEKFIVKFSCQFEKFNGREFFRVAPLGIVKRNWEETDLQKE